MQVQILQIIAFAVMACGAALTITFALLYSRKKQKPFKHISRVCLVLALAGLIGTACLAFIVHDAVAHGAYEIGDMTVSEMLDHTAKSPVDQSAQLEDEPKDSIVYLYRYTCPDCEDVHEDLMKWLDSTGKPWIAVSSRSDKGLDLRNELGIKEVPAIIYFDRNGEYVQRVVYVRESRDEPAVLDEKALGYLERMMKDA